MNEEKKVPFKWEYGEETISLQLGMYAYPYRRWGGTVCRYDGEPSGVFLGPRRGVYFR